MLRLVGILGLIAIAGHYLAPLLLEHLAGHQESHLLMPFFDIAAIFAASFISFHASSKTRIPSFVTAIFFGIAARPFLENAIANTQLLGVIVGLAATLILFGGGLETPFKQFRESIFKILVISIPGMILTAFLASQSASWISASATVPLLVSSAILLGAVLASTDPAAIIPILKNLRFKNPATKTIIISESALTDAVGALLTITFLGLIAGGAVFTSVAAGYSTALLSAESLGFLTKQIVIGSLFGFVGFVLLELFVRFKKRHSDEFEVDAAFFLFVPIVIFLLSLLVGGSGYLAAFVAGLLFKIKENLHQTDQFFNRSIEGFLKPTIFLLLGALVDLDSLLEYAAIGIPLALVFIVIIRPAAVLACLGPFSLLGKRKTSLRELLFISFVRETGAIPAVLLISIASLGIPQADMIVAIGLWVILMTLLIEPPLTPFVARLLDVAEPIKQSDVVSKDLSDKPFVVLGTRGFSFLRRLPFVVEWAQKHHISKIVILLCLESRYTKKLENEMHHKLNAIVKDLHLQQTAEGKSKIEIQFISNKGFLQENIKHLAEHEQDLTVIFIGRKVLDYRMDEIKQLPVPFYFLD